MSAVVENSKRMKAREVTSETTSRNYTEQSWVVKSCGQCWEYAHECEGKVKQGRRGKTQIAGYQEWVNDK